MSGIAQFISSKGINTLKTWMKNGYKEIRNYDEKYSEWFAIPKSRKVTSVKPSGTISLLVGATPGMHYPKSRFYIRRVRLNKESDLITPLKRSGFNVEPDVANPEHTVVVSIPVDVGQGIRTLKEISIWEQMSLAAFIQRYWSDNQVSCTVTFEPNEADQIEHSLNYFQYKLKGISFLPRKTTKVYPQMPYEEIDEETYNKMIKDIKPINFSKRKVKNEMADVEKFCSNDTCTLTITPIKSKIKENEK